MLDLLRTLPATRAFPKALKKIGLPAIAGAVAIAAIVTTAQAADFPGVFRGNAYATFANVKAGSVAASLGRSAFIKCTCAGTDGQTQTNEVTSISAGAGGNVLIAADTLSTAFTTKTATSAQVQNTSTISNLNALGGLITADEIEAVATVNAVRKSVTTSSDGSTFSNLVIAGQHIPVDVPQNTVIPLAGLGSVTLYKVTPAGNMRTGGQVLVEMLNIQVSAKNTLGLAVGTKIVIGHALSGFSVKQPPAQFDGAAYVAFASGKLDITRLNAIGKSAFVTFGCEGTAGKTKTNSIGSQNVNGVMSLSDGETTAFTGSEGDAIVSRTTASSGSLNLLGGLITVNGLQAVATSTLRNGTSTGSADGSGFTGLTVAGLPVSINLPPNTGLTLPGLGKVIVNEQKVQNDGSVTVNGSGRLSFSTGSGSRSIVAMI